MSYQVFQNKPQKQVQIIALCPLARVFQPYQTLDSFLNNPLTMRAALGKNEKIEIIVEGGHATKIYELGRVYTVNEDEAIQLVGVSNDRMNNEYASSGIVYFDAPRDIKAALQYEADSGQQLPKDVKKKLDDFLGSLKVLSEKRIIDHCKRTYASMVEGRRKEKEAGKVPQVPGDMDMILTYILSEEIKKTKSIRAKMMAEFNSLESEISGDVGV